jgi:uncharacterized protein YegP (UPF0339 family)
MPKFEVYSDEIGGYHFRLRARNGQIIAVSQSYKSKEGCLKGIKSVKLNASSARIVILETEHETEKGLSTGTETKVSV